MFARSFESTASHPVVSLSFIVYWYQAHHLFCDIWGSCKWPQMVPDSSPLLMQACYFSCFLTITTWLQYQNITHGNYLCLDSICSWRAFLRQKVSLLCLFHALFGQISWPPELCRKRLRGLTATITAVCGESQNGWALGNWTISTCGSHPEESMTGFQFSLSSTVQPGWG